MVASDTLEIVEYLRALHPRLRLGIHTNGSGRQPEWWARLAQVVDYCRFGIDGLEDTNHLYRRGTNWKRIMKSATSFISTGGRAEWDFIVFRHNEHQVEEARALSRQMGFAAFFIKNTYRFLNPLTGRRLSRIGVISREGELEYFVEEPSDSTFQNKSLIQLGRTARNSVEYQAYLDGTKVTCKAAVASKIYVSAEGLVFPCCWLANLYPWYESRSRNGVRRLIDELPEGEGSLDARQHPIGEIVDGPFFQRLVPGSWTRRSLSEGRLEVCTRTCGTFDLYSAQFLTPTLHSEEPSWTDHS